MPATRSRPPHPVRRPRAPRGRRLADVAAAHRGGGDGRSHCASRIATVSRQRDTDGTSTGRRPQPHSGKNPASTPDNGGFTGWRTLSADPRHGRVADLFDVLSGDSGTWLRAEVHARTDAVDIVAPATLTVGGAGHASATISQDGTRTVPVARRPSSPTTPPPVRSRRGTPAPRCCA
ncbi:hypothetical protein ACH5AL_31400 [Actinacidiphila glaucinigra]|uniref:hypothetical protein n=1 Tax=Actinacidiphila glaucinigra TaxID=235986 RepID=UPI00378B4EF2